MPVSDSTRRAVQFFYDYFASPQTPVAERLSRLHKSEGAGWADPHEDEKLKAYLEAFDRGGRAVQGLSALQPIEVGQLLYKHLAPKNRAQHALFTRRKEPMQKLMDRLIKDAPSQEDADSLVKDWLTKIKTDFPEEYEQLRLAYSTAALLCASPNAKIDLNGMAKRFTGLTALLGLTDRSEQKQAQMLSNALLHHFAKGKLVQSVLHELQEAEQQHAPFKRTVTRRTLADSRNSSRNLPKKPENP